MNEHCYCDSIFALGTKVLERQEEGWCRQEVSGGGTGGRVVQTGG